MIATMMKTTLNGFVTVVVVVVVAIVIRCSTSSSMEIGGGIGMNDIHAGGKMNVVVVVGILEWGGGWCGGCKVGPCILWLLWLLLSMV